jgi:hypothetical protein
MLHKAIFRIIFIAPLFASILFILSWLHNQRIPAPTSRENGTSPGETNEQQRRQRSENSVIPDPKAGRQSGVFCESKYFASWNEPPFHSCQIALRNGYPVPDPRCTPGGKPVHLGRCSQESQMANSFDSELRIKRGNETFRVWVVRYPKAPSEL